MQRMTKRGVDWLSAAADGPVECRAAWSDDPRAPYALSAGGFFDVVPVEQRIGLEAFDQLLRRDLPFGPVVHNHKARRVGFFLGARSSKTFAHHLVREADADAPPWYRYLGMGSVIVIPGLMLMTGDRYQWLRGRLIR